jgi:hypothetical protein
MTRLWYPTEVRRRAARGKPKSADRREAVPKMAVGNPLCALSNSTGRGRVRNLALIPRAGRRLPGQEGGQDHAH